MPGRVVVAPPPLPAVVVPADPPPSEVIAHAALNGGVSSVIVRGSPAVILSGVVALGIDGGIPLTEESLSLSVTSLDGGVQDWPFQRLTPPVPGHLLRAMDFEAEITWALDEAATARLPVGGYVLTFSWAGASTTLHFEVQDPPRTPSATWEENKVDQRASLLRKQKRLPEALALANQGLATWPDSYELWETKALILEDMGDLRAAFAAASQMQRVLREKYPDQKHGIGGGTYQRLFDAHVYESLLK